MTDRDRGTVRREGDVTEQVQVSTSVVPVERVRLVRRVVSGEQRVTGALRSERIDAEYLDTAHHPTTPDDAEGTPA